MSGGPSKREIILETVQVGTALRITAVDVATGTEVVFQAPAATSALSIQKLAADKLKYVIDRQQKRS